MYKFSGCEQSALLSSVLRDSIVLGSFCISIALSEGTLDSARSRAWKIDSGYSSPHNAHLVTVEGVALVVRGASRLLSELLDSDCCPSRNILCRRRR